MSGRGWPTVGDYAARVRERGCTISDRVVDGGQPLRLLRIEAGDGRCATEIFMAWSDQLASTSIARLDRQLGIKTNFFV